MSLTGMIDGMVALIGVITPSLGVFIAAGVIIGGAAFLFQRFVRTGR